MYDNWAMNYIQIITLIISLLALGLSIAALLSFSKFKQISQLFFAGKKAENLEDFIITQSIKINELTVQSDYIEKSVKNLKDMQRFSIQKIGMRRYNPFNDEGGNLSFSLALLDDHHNGVVITSMHGREQNRIYAKPIKDGHSEYSLTEEELTAINESKNF